MNRLKTKCVALETRFFLFTLLFLLMIPQFVYGFVYTNPFGNDFILYQPLSLFRFLTYFENGCFPLWSSLMFGGMSSAFEQALSQVLAPITWLYLFFDGALSGQLLKIMTTFKLLSIGLAGCFAYIFFFRISSSRVGAWFGALTFMFNFRMLDNFRYNTPVEILTLLPLLLWFTDKIVCREGLLSILAYPFALGTMLLYGYHQHGLYNLLLLSVYFLFRLALKKETTLSWRVYLRQQMSTIGLFALLNFIGILFATPLLIPFQQDVLPYLGVRVSGGFQWTDQFRLTFLSGFMNFGLPWLADVHSAFYSSLLATLFFFWAIGLLFNKTSLDKHSRYFLLFFLSYFIFTFLYALGSSLYVSTWIQSLIFPLKSSRCHGRILGTGILCFAGISVFVFKYLETRLSTRQPIEVSLPKVHFLYGTLSILFLGLGSYFAYQHYLQITNASTVASSWLQLFTAFFHFSITFLLDSYNPCKIAESPQMVFFQFSIFLLLYVVVGLLIGLILFRQGTYRLVAYSILTLLILIETHFYHQKGTWVADNFVPQRAEQFLNLDLYHHRLYLPEYGNPLENNFNAPKAMTDFYGKGGPGSKLLYQDLSLGKLFVPQSYFFVNDVASTLKQQFMDLRNFCWLEASELEKLDSSSRSLFGLNSPSVTLPFRSSFLSDPSPAIQVLVHTPNKIRFQIYMKTPGIVNYLDAYHPNFIAFVDGKKVPVLKTYGTFKGVFVPEGEHLVTIEYYPTSFFISLWVCFLTATLFLSIMGQRFLRQCYPHWPVRFSWRLAGILLIVLLLFFGWFDQKIHQWASADLLLQCVNR